MDMTIDELRALTPEAAFQSQVIAYARTLGWRVAHFRPVRTMHAGKVRYMTPVQADGAGFPDLVLVRDGRLLFIELKTEKGQLTQDQFAWREALLLCGQEYFVFRPSMWAEIERILT